jgi:hypothetical protein
MSTGPTLKRLLAPVPHPGEDVLVVCDPPNVTGTAHPAPDGALVGLFRWFRIRHDWQFISVLTDTCSIMWKCYRIPIGRVWRGEVNARRFILFRGRRKGPQMDSSSLLPSITRPHAGPDFL